MKTNRQLLLIAGILFSSLLSAQTNGPRLKLRNGQIDVRNNIRKSFIDSFNVRTARVNDKAFAVLQFDQIPNADDRKVLHAYGIDLLDYIPDNAYTVSISGKLNTTILERLKARSIIELSPQQKMEEHLASGVIPSWASKIAGTADVWISYPKTFTLQEVMEQLAHRNIDVLSLERQAYRILSLRIARNRLTELASLPFVEYVQPAPPAPQALNLLGLTGSKTEILHSSLANGGKGLNGEGVVVGIGDNADIQSHPDFAQRLIDRSFEPSSSGHGYHTTGTMAGAGNILDWTRGYLPKAAIVSQGFNRILTNAATYFNDYGMVVTSNSYGDIINCDYHGTYDLSSQMLDQMAIDLPYVQNVFAAGNSGQDVCSPFQAGFHTVLGGYQSAKNVLTVGATTDSAVVANFSSRGPVKDGRVKPELTTMGQDVYSCLPGNSYGFSNGTSMACPGVAGGLGLLYQRYRQLNGGANPKNGLMKAIICNGASDKGNSGPDFSYGFGFMNLLRSVDMIEKGHYLTSSVANGTSNSNTISVPSNTAQLKVMLYWNDPAASPLSTKTLVNDLDLEVADPSAVVSYPLILDTANASLTNTAITGQDHKNNIEQVVINSPAAGNYTITVKGTSITQNPSQEYFVAYDIVPVQFKLTSPAGGEAQVPSTGRFDMLPINWEANGYASGTVTIEYSLDNGGSWSTIATGVDIKRSMYSWWVPNVAAGQARIRITKEGTGESSTSEAFIILGRPTVSLASTQCEGYINLSWNAIAGATDYEVMMLQADSMTTVAATSATTYSIGGLCKDSTYWVTVRARVNGQPGRRATAISRQPNSGTCSGTISDNDLKLDSIIAPVTGRKYTSSELSAATAVTIRIKNLDDVPLTGFTVQYSINGGAWITESPTATINGGSTYDHTFSTTQDMSLTGAYTITAVVNYPGDPVPANDTAIVTVKQLDNQAINLTTNFIDDVEAAAVNTYTSGVNGFDGLDRYDFSSTTSVGRLRTYVNSGMAYSGTKAFTLDVNQYYSSGSTNYLTGTYNLTNYDVNLNDVRLDFTFNNHGQQSDPNNRVWIRGNETASWIEAYNLDSNENDPGTYKKTNSIELSHLLAVAGQTFSPSFQIRWGQAGQFPATEPQLASGYSFDDIRIYEVQNDMQMLSIDAPATASCALSGTTAIKVTVKNSSANTLLSVPIKYRIDGGSWISESISSIAANTTVQYTFTTTADLSALGQHSMQAIVDLSTDSFHDNDTATISITNSPVVSTFPYLENFESGNGYWYAGGKNSSWEYGTPGSQKINHAASGAKAWKTRLVGNYNDYEQSYLYSPCFDVSTMTHPMLSFSAALDLEDCGTTLCDAAWLEYSSDGVSWNKLGNFSKGTNWYNKNPDDLWSVQGYTRWHVATIPLPAGNSRLRLRFVMSSDMATNYEGIAIDDIHVYDSTNSIYNGASPSPVVTNTVSGNNWVDFTSSGQLVASIYPNNQNLGATDVQAFINTGAVRYWDTQYYHDRNLTIKPANNNLADSATVRFYFLDSESEALISATGCSTCSKPASAYDLGVSKYDDPDKSFENGSVSDDNQGTWNFITPDNAVRVPFDKGYYVQFKVKDFSELWLNNGGFSKSSPLPVRLVSFTAQKSNTKDVLLNWMVEESNVDHYEIEVARGNTALQRNQFSKLNEVSGHGGAGGMYSYSFTDNEPDKSGPRYYRLKIVDKDGSFQYSPVRSVVFGEMPVWLLYPNPSEGVFHLSLQADNGVQLQFKVIDTKGSVVKEYHTIANGFPQKLNIDLGSNQFAGGVYLLEVNEGGKLMSFKLYKQKK